MARPAIKPLYGAITLLLTWYTRRRSRIELARLDARVVRDAGIDWLDARREADKPFWRR